MRWREELWDFQKVVDKDQSGGGKWKELTNSTTWL